MFETQAQTVSHVWQVGAHLLLGIMWMGAVITLGVASGSWRVSFPS